MTVEEFVASVLPPVPARLLEVGCGAGDLARSLAARGYDVTAIDPHAPDGPLFQQVTLEDFTDTEPFDAVVASTSLHHIHDLTAALEKIRDLLRPRGVVILNEFGWDRMDERTARWFASHVAAPDDGGEAMTASDVLEKWNGGHEELHDSVTMRRALDAAFVRRLFEWKPFLAEHELERPDLTGEELELIQSGEITAIGFRYIGERA
jgi:SAM-dependent methyltransferase